jgi:pimeloyl-ACP methyl ester carboxylesterase
MGHSFGGYIMSQYAIKNYEIIDNLYLLSPVGITY